MNAGHFIERLEQIARSANASSLSRGLKGLEKESLRITTDGRIAQSPHPKSLGSALTHPHITTDYSEALLELITPPDAESRSTLDFLDTIHRFVHQRLTSNEIALATSMPCGFEHDDDIPIARYGTSNIGRMKYVYRMGLAYRYGRAMQAIAGIHFNYSLPESLWPILQEAWEDTRPLRSFQSDIYFSMIRNLQRYGWLLLYLFGASPAVCKAFLACRGEVPPEFVELSPNTYCLPYATSLRMSDIGYKNQTQSNLYISCNNLEEYVESLCHAVETPHPPYQAIGVKVGNEYRQLNANILQIENEYYSSVRPKQIAERGEKPTIALKRRGVRYVEVRALDLNPYEPLGIDLEQIHFLEAFLLYCLLQDSPPLSREENQTIQANLLATAQRGRDPALTLSRNGDTIALRQWAESISKEMEPLCQLLDASLPTNFYQTALAQQQARIEDANLTPSARILSELRANEESFAAFALRRSTQHAAHFRDNPLQGERLLRFEHLSRQSLQEQYRVEAEDRMNFDEFLKHYFSQTCQNTT
ncbi:MAG: glutamate--cysteine ligase [Methylohalobius sp. ZOD2]